MKKLVFSLSFSFILITLVLPADVLAIGSLEAGASAIPNSQLAGLSH